MLVQFHYLWLAIGFYTRLPTPGCLDYDELPKASCYLPLIGWLVGGVSAGCFYAFNLLWPHTVAVIVALVAGILLTGAFHEDGFADVCDGFGGGYDPQRILDIMKDSRIGAYGVIGLFLMLGLKIALLSALPTLTVPSILIAGHSLSRFAPLLLMASYDYVRSQSKGRAAMYRPSYMELFAAGLTALLPLSFLPPKLYLAVPIILFVNGCLGRYFFRHIGGYTGDCLGASQQIVETVFYLTASALWTSI